MIRTTGGDVDSESWGPTNYHEHLFQVTPLLPGDELDDEELSRTEAELLNVSGFTAMVEATPLGLGQRPEAVARISAATGLTVVATTGRHREAHYRSDHWIRTVTPEQLSQRLISDLTTGMLVSDVSAHSPVATSPSGEPVRAGVLKAGIDYWRMSPFEYETLDAVANAHRQTGAPVMVHVEMGTAMHEVLDVLSAQGVSESAVALAHADRNPDSGLHLSLVERGAFLGYDGMARPKGRTDEELLELIARVVEGRGGNNIVLGGDVARRTRYLAYGGMPGLEYLGRRFVPRLASRLGPSAVEKILTHNSSRWLSWTTL